MAIELKQSSLITIGSLISKLFESRTQAHIYHLQTKSFAAHKALDEYYSSIVDLADSIVEVYQGEFGIVKGYTPGILKEDDNPIAYLKDILKFVENSRYKAVSKECTDIQNIIDEVIALLKSAIYKLTFLK